MKTIKILAMTLLLAIQMTACNAGDKVITGNELPAAAQTFISKYFSGKQVSLVKKDKEGLQTMRNLARNMTFMIRAIHDAKGKYGLPEVEHGSFTSFPDGK